MAATAAHAAMLRAAMLRAACGDAALSIMFQPPEAPASSFGLRQILGFGQGDDPFFARVRGEQVAVLYRLSRFSRLLKNGRRDQA